MKLDTTAKIQANDLDTKAALVYKSGHPNEAIAIEQKAADLQPKSNKGYIEKIEKMRRGEKLWLEEN